MKQIVFYLEGDEYRQMYELDRDMLIVQNGSVTITMAEARELHDRNNAMWCRLRQEHDLDPEESYVFDQQTGAVFVDKWDE